MRVLGVAFAVLACAACSSPDPSVSDDSGSADVASDTAALDDGASLDGSPDAGPPAPPQYCTAETPIVVANGNAFNATTTHYDLYAETTNADTTELARLLEASEKAFEAWFESPFPLASGQRLKVKYFKDEPSWTAGIQADGIAAPTGAGGYYSPTTKTAYLYRQGNPYYSHVLTVHEALHQFHYLSRIKAPSPLPFWYIEGHAEYLARHDWDGSCIRLGVTSLLSWEDLPATVAGPLDVTGIINGTVTPTRGDSWALFRYLDTGAYKAGFQAYRDALDATGTASFASLVAPPATLAAPIASWLPTAQEPMKPVFTEWIHVDSQRVLVDTPVVFSVALVKANATHFETKLEVPASNKWTAGVVVAFKDAANFLAVVQASDGTVRTFTVAGSALWNDLGTAPLPSGKLEIVTVDLANGKATVTFNGTPFTVTSANTARVGLAASDTTARFIDIKWK